MFTRLIRYYFLVVVILFSLIIAADFIFQKTVQRSQYSGLEQSVGILLDVAKHHCANDGCDAQTQLPSDKLILIEASSLALPASQKDKLMRGEMLLVSERGDQYFYHQLTNQWVLEIGPLKTNEPVSSHWYSTTFYVFLGLAFLLVLWPLYKDIWRIKEATEQFARSKELSQLSMPDSRFFKPVTDTITWMLNKIARLLALQNELSGTLSHELRTNLARLKFTLACLSSDNAEETKQLLKQDVVEIESLVEQYLNFAKAEHEQPELSFAQHRLSPTIDTYLEQLSTYSEKSYVFTIDADPEVYVDLPFLSRAIKNLIDNAFKYGDASILLTLYSNDNGVVLRVEDDGLGCDSNQVDELFLPYTRQNTTQLGYGLGLAITKKIILWHSGTISVRKSEELGGACFEMFIPFNQ
ncbi:sensor histidine kinase [Pseudoalteromonas sp. GB56]